jgi:glycosyltransferase involved in cell wall biosynthesis
MTSQGMAIRTLYLCYFGIKEPLVQTQVLPYLRQLSAAGIDVNLLTFESHLRDLNDDQLAEQREQLAAEGITWFYLPYHKSPSVPATVYDILAGARFAVQLVRRKGINVLHARAHVPMAMALLAQRFVRVKLIFDIRGLMAEEYADAGIWPHDSRRFRMVKKLERAGIHRADQIVVLTQRLRDWLLAHNLKRAEQIEVIPCCVDFARFEMLPGDVQPQDARSSAINRFEVVYAGSLGGLYLVEEMGRFFKALKAQRPDAFLRILSVSPPEQGAVVLKRAGLSETDFQIRAVLPTEVPAHLHQARLGLSFRKQAFAQIAASPTKISEYLAAGVPIICNAGIGDTDELVKRERVGIVLRDFQEATYRGAATKALALAEDADVGARCRRVARERFDLKTVGGQSYVNVYRRLSADQPEQRY